MLGAYETTINTWPKADAHSQPASVGFRSKSGHRADLSECPLMTQNGHSAASNVLSPISHLPLQVANLSRYCCLIRDCNAASIVQTGG